MSRDQRHNLKDLTNKKQETEGKYNIKIILFYLCRLSSVATQCRIYQNSWSKQTTLCKIQTA